MFSYLEWLCSSRRGFFSFPPPGLKFLNEDSWRDWEDSLWCDNERWCGWMDGKRQLPGKETKISFFSNEMVESESVPMSPLRQEWDRDKRHQPSRSARATRLDSAVIRGLGRHHLKNDTTAIIGSMTKGGRRVWVWKWYLLITRLPFI